MKKISLKPKDEQVQIVESPPDADFLEVHKVLSKDKPSIRELADLIVRGIVPMQFKTNRSVNGKEPAVLELIPQDITALPNGRGWSWRGQSTNASSFRTRGNRKTAPITEGTVGSTSVDNRFVVV